MAVRYYFPETDAPLDELELYCRKQMRMPKLFAEIQHHCDLFQKAIDESVAKWSEAKQREFQSQLAAARLEADRVSYIEFAKIARASAQDPCFTVDSMYENLVAYDLHYYLEIFRDNGTSVGFELDKME